MATLSLRLSSDLDARLTEESRLSDVPKSLLAREALEEYVSRRRRERLLAELTRAARALDPKRRPPWRPRRCPWTTRPLKVRCRTRAGEDERHLTTGRDRLRRGEIWVANLNPNRGQEIGKVRPVLIVQGDWLTDAQSRTVVVLPMTSYVRPEVHPLRVTVVARGRLRADSQVVVEQPRTLDRDRIGDGPLTELTAAEMTHVEESLLAVLGVFRE